MELKNLSFEELLEINCYSEDENLKHQAAVFLERYYGCEIYGEGVDRSVLFAHHARGCTIIAAKICENVVIYQNVTIGSNMRYNKETATWENVGNPILDKGVVVVDGAKILGPIVIGENSVIGAGAIVTKDVPANSVVTGVNQIKPKNPKYDLVFNPNMISGEEIMKQNQKFVDEFEKSKQ